MRRYALHTVLTLAAVVACAGGIHASGPGDERPRIGIALSGGGARGLAHIGVLRVLEEEGLQADIVTGTSMGSIIGGLYAAGYSPAFIERMATETDWFELFQETVERRYVPMRQKPFRDRYLAAFPIKKGRVSLPSGIIKGQKIHRLFYRLTWPVIETEDFSRLPRSFSCVATDLATGEPYVIDKGSLADAMRTSMAIPTAFTPVHRDGRVLVDGGLTRNLPSSDAVDLGADIVICVDVSGALVGADSLDNVLEIVDQSLDIMMKSTVDGQKKYCDLYIRPQLGTIGTLDFTDIPSIIERGEEAARKNIDGIRALVAETGGPRGKPNEMEETPRTSIWITGIRFEGLSSVSSKLVSSLVGIQTPTAVTADDVDKALRRLYSTGDFSMITYGFVSSGDGNDLVFDFEEESPSYLGLGLRYDTRWSFSALIGARMKNLAVRGSTMNLDMVFSKRMNLFGTYSVEMGLGRYLMAGAAANYVNDDIETFVDGERNSKWSVSAGRAALLLESSLGYVFRCVAGAGGEWYSITPDIAPAGSLKESGGLFYAGGDLWVDTLDRSWMPRRGLMLKVSGQYYPDPPPDGDSYARSYAHITASLPVHRRVSLCGRFLYGITGGGKPLPHHEFQLGGFMSWFDYYGRRDVPFYGYEPFEFSGANAWLAGARLQVQITARVLAAFDFNAGAARDDRSTLFDGVNIHAGGAGTLAVESPAGPIELTVSLGERGNLGLWFGIGFPF